MLRVLSIDGGGIRGIIPSTVLMELESMSQRQTFELFDLIVGTSTGGILALALTCPTDNGVPQPAHEARNLYLERGKFVFPLGGVPIIGVPKSIRAAIFGVRVASPPGTSLPRRIYNSTPIPNLVKGLAPLGMGYGNARYPAEPLEKELRSQLADKNMSQAFKPVIVVSCDLARREPLVFRGGGLPQDTLGDVKMWEAARATSAGPTFFPAIGIRDLNGVVHECVDGGLVANDPAFLAFTEAMTSLASAGQRIEDILLVSLGTGTKRPDEPPEVADVAQLVDPRPWPQIASGVFATLGAASGELTRIQLHQLLGPHYIRLQTSLLPGAEHAMDNVYQKNIDALKRTGEYLVEMSRSKLEQLVPLLVS